MGNTVAESLAVACDDTGYATCSGRVCLRCSFLATPEQSIRQVVYRAENAGGAMADGYARVTGKVSVVAAQNGRAEIETAVRMDLPITVVVLNNAILGYQKHSELYQFATHTDAIDFAPVDHAAIAAACGARGVRLESAADLAAELRTALAAPVATVVDVITDPDAYPPISAWDGDPTLSELAGGTRRWPRQGLPARNVT